jgi:hypothetical protein
MDINFTDVYVYNKNQKGVEYLVNHYTSEVIAKKCTSCGKWKFQDEYNKAGKGFAGTHSLCRPCHRKRNAELREDKRVDQELNEAVSREIENTIKMNMPTRRIWF